MKAMKAVLYARTSTKKQDTAMQLDELRQYIKARRWKLVREYIDAGESGANPSRANFTSMWSDAKRRSFDVLVCWSIDRLGRSVPDVTLFMADCLALGVKFVALHEGIDVTIPSGLFVAQVVAAHAQFERAIQCQRVASGIAKARRRGVTLGRPRSRVPVTDIEKAIQEGWSIRRSAAAIGVSPATFHRRLSDYKNSRKGARA